jgi:hypothetical protein
MQVSAVRLLPFGQGVVLGQPDQQHGRLHREVRVELNLAPAGLRRV